MSLVLHLPLTVWMDIRGCHGAAGTSVEPLTVHVSCSIYQRQPRDARLGLCTLTVR
jgi:hypothetical protein